uniref:Uncharacterized protein n=1 Tax=Peronospora matthiolae TaxID=2874970 RepID=A0AAV1TN75_9STRA
MEVEEEGRRSPHDHVEACVPESLFDRLSLALRGDLEHERDRRLQLADNVLNIELSLLLLSLRAREL